MPLKAYPEIFYAKPFHRYDTWFDSPGVGGLPPPPFPG